MKKIMVIMAALFTAQTGYADDWYVGVLVSLFTAIIVTRTFLHLVLDNIKLAEHPRWFGL